MHDFMNGNAGKAPKGDSVQAGRLSPATRKSDYVKGLKGTAPASVFKSGKGS